MHTRNPLRISRRHAVGIGLALALAGAGMAAQAKDIVVAMVPKFIGIDYFNAAKKGGEDAAKELKNVKLLWRGPTEGRADKQIEILEGLITAKVDVLAVSANDPSALAPVLEKARKAGIKVVTWDADADVRDLFVNQATAEGIGTALIDSMADQIGKNGKAVIITSDLASPNQNAWIDAMKARIASTYPDFKILDIKAPGNDQQKAFEMTQDVLKAYPDVQGIIAISSVALPGAAEAVKQAGKTGKVAVNGLATPKAMAPYVKAGVIRDVVLWNPVDLGYLTIYGARAAVDGHLAEGKAFSAGKLGSYTPVKDAHGLTILLGKPTVFNKANIDKFNF